MFRSKTPRTIESIIAGLTKKHGKLLKTDEHFVAVCDAFAPDHGHPPPIGEGLKASDFEIPFAEGQPVNGQAHLRLNTVRAALGHDDFEFTELPSSNTGYLLAHSQQRLFIFDGSGKRYELQAPVAGLWLQAIDHGDGLFTLVFDNGEERVAVATRRESIELTRHFVDTFPDRRGTPRVMPMTPSQDVIEF